MLSKDDILSADDLKTEVVQVPEWKGEVMIMEMTGAMKDTYETHISMTPAEFRDRVIRARLVALSVVDPETKELMFTQADIDALAKKSGKALDRVFERAAVLNRLTDAGVEEAAGN